jgi:type IX secretion system PorP/SprF family membrane protein
MAQDLPVFSQKLTDSFIYNPAIAGNGIGSMMVSHRNNFAGVEGAPSSNYLSLHMPFHKYRFGVGMNVFQERANTMTSTFANAAFAYHLDLGNNNSLSFGLSGEYNAARLSDDMISQNGNNDLVLSRYSSTVPSPDFSFGTVVKTKYLNFGVAANRLFTAWKGVDSVKKLTNYYHAFVQGNIPFQNGEVALQPYLAIRRYNDNLNIIDLGLFYSYQYKLLAGVSIRSNNIYSVTAGYYLNKKLMVGYSREMILGDFAGYLGASNEFLLRYNYMEKEKVRSLRSSYDRKSSDMSFRKVKKMAKERTRETFKSDIQRKSKRGKIMPKRIFN